MMRNPYAGDAARMHGMVLRSGRGREAQTGGPADDRATGTVGTVLPDGSLRLYGLLDITTFAEGFILS